MPSNINRLAVPTLAKGLHVVVKPCNLRQGLLFKEIAILAVPRSPCLQNPLSMTAQASLMAPAVPGRRVDATCSGASKGDHYIGTYGGAPMSPLRHPAKAKAPRSLIVIAVSIRLVRPAVRPGQASHESYSSKAISKARRSFRGNLLGAEEARVVTAVRFVNSL
jgi:hypothetical protein